MKKKFVLVLALVLLVASTAFAGDVKFSGRVRQGYVFKFDMNNNDNNSVGQQRSAEGKFAINVSDADGLWSLAFASVTGDLDSDDKFAASASVSLSKALAAAGVDMGAFTVDYTIGNNKNDTQLNAYSDKAGKHWQRMKTNGTMVTTLTVGYDKYGKAKIAFDPTTATKTIEVSALITAVDGLKFGLGYGHNVKVKNGGVDAKNGLSADFAVDVPKLMNNKDFSLVVSGAVNVKLADSDVSGDKTIGYYAATVSGGVEKVDGYVEYALLDTTDFLKVQANAHIVKGMGLDAYVTFAGMKNDKTDMTIGGDVSYTLGGVAYSLNAEFCDTKTKDVKTFSITPAIAIAF